MKVLIDNINNLTNEDIVNLKNSIKQERLKYINKLINIENQKRSLLGEKLLLKCLLDNNIDYDDITILKNDSGKPFIKNSNLFFNISHSADYVVLAYSNYEIGIDIEKIREFNPKMIDIIASNEEKKYVMEKNTLERFFVLYTLKESYIKCYGKRLQNIKDVEFYFDNNKVFCSDKSVSLIVDKSIEGYIISICKKI